MGRVERALAARFARAAKHPAISVANASDAAVHEVFVDLFDPADQQRTRMDVGQVPPGQTRHRDVLSPLPDDPAWARLD
jgi:hypothetical protein